ncbi:MAG: hypothetical protein HY521_14985 [Proteobacteria bacterium]|nr:hypothetical protein [Pseudomonadota bacterium]
MGYGFNGHIGLRKEAAWGTPLAADSYLEALSETLAASIDRFETKNIVGGTFEPDDQPGVVRIEGDIVAPAHPVSVGHFLKAALGVSSPATVAAGTLFATSFVPQQADTFSNAPLPSYTLEVFRDVTSAQRYAGACVSRLELAFRPNQDLWVRARLVARSTADIAAGTPTFPASPAAPFAFDTASVSLAGAATDLVEALTLTVDNRLEGVPALNAAREIARVRRTGPVAITLAGTLAFPDIAQYRNFLDQAEQRLTVHVTRANSFALTLDLPRVVFTAFPLATLGRDRHVVEFEARARYHPGSATALKVTLTTTKSDY